MHPVSEQQPAEFWDSCIWGQLLPGPREPESLSLGTAGCRHMGL
eukprot:CAMPEP_0173387062 /NCGR_PEP_ID=MMETSP1356-20130122/9620_1 /TAXON_ID=77927 ORGANISM="Hemiselmis virescens, Strain PCC157" /NCGR_SAMPLE_ID=MMETSP1356 /ASSEMBLY_ACC=CAM_ASM_000847 /LENGTH=43 /DNA_ID= /DNA_START= /DNA_END= /DNA_ORIENTATION=